MFELHDTYGDKCNTSELVLGFRVDQEEHDLRGKGVYKGVRDLEVFEKCSSKSLG